MKFNYFHSIEKGARDSIKSISRCDKHTVGEIHGELDEVVAERLVLLTVENLEHCGRRVAMCIAAHLVDLVKEHYGVAGAALRERVDDASGH